MTAKQNKEVEVYYMIKVGESYVEKVELYSYFEEPQKETLKNLVLTKRQDKAAKFYYDNESECQTSDQYEMQKYFEAVKKALEREGIHFKTIVTKVTTTVEQETLSAKNENTMSTIKFTDKGLFLKGSKGITITTHTGEKILPKGHKEDATLYDIIYTVALQAIQDTNELEAEEFAKTLSDELKRNIKKFNKECDNTDK